MRLRLTTPCRMRLFLTGMATVLLGFVIALAVAVSAVSDGLRVVGHGAGPRVAAANELYGGLAGMDAELANVLLVGDETGLGFDRQAALNSYKTDREAVAKALQQAAEGANDTTARNAVDELVAGIGTYDNLAGQVMLTDRQADTRAISAPSPALALLRQATDLMHDHLLPAADRLINDDAADVEHAFSSNYGSARTAGYAALFLGLAAIGILVAAQVFLFLRTHRILNLGLITATLLTAVLLAQAVNAVFGATEQLRVAKRDSFDSVLALTRTKAIVADANGDESRYLVDFDRATRYQDAFFAKSELLATIPSVGMDGYDAALADAEQGFEAYARGVEPPFAGPLFGREFRNITFTGERAAAEEAFRWYRTYQLFDRQMRALAQQDKRKAVDFNTSYKENNSNWSYDRLQNALDAVNTIDRTHMDTAANDGEDTLTGWAFIPAVGAVVIAAVAYAGMRPRLREYQAAP